MEPSAIDAITTRLSSIEGLYFPHSIQISSPPPSPPHRKTLLLDLLRREPPIFLERYGPLLTLPELRSFETLGHSYEVQFHLIRLRSRFNPTAEDQRSRSVRIKNRRRAYMEGLMRAGDYFSEEAMREREPYLHFEMLGRYQDPMGRVISRPGEPWSETLMRRCEEAAIVEKIRGEQRRLGVDQREWIGGGGEEEEEEEDDDDEESEDSHDDGSRSPKEHGEQDTHGTAAEPFEPSISAEEMQDQLDQFTHIMQQKFLAGEDTEHLDYSKIDDDERLDDHWLKEANHDAEEKYFDED